MASISGGEIRVLLSTDGGTTYKGFALESDCSFEMNAETREVTSKDDAVYRSYVTSAKNWTISGSALFGDDDATNWNPDQLYDSIGSQVDIKITQCAAGTVTPATGETKIEGDAILTSLSASVPDKDNGTYTFSLQGTGAWTIGTN
jgi:predicted secreted protein